MIVALAGHVDHGKTSLVRALTGVNTDRLAEEQRRGLTIDLGFAYLDDGSIGFVDVPGHHKFIHNMVAGIASDQSAMLVIAADDGPMPQSREHLDILGLMGLKQGVIVMTKCDRASPARQDECEAEIRTLVAHSFLADAPVFRTSIEDTDSTSRLLSHLKTQGASHHTEDEGAFRLAIDRAFVVKGSGVVVTGTVHEGKLQNDDSLHLFPSGTTVRVRGLRTQNRETDIAVRGDRCAINLSGVELKDITRGDWLSSVAVNGYPEVTLELTVLKNFPRAVKQWTPVHVYHATSHAQGHIALLDEKRLTAGERAMVDLVLDTPLAVQSSDQIILRDQGLDTTLGGGRVVYASTRPTPRRRNHQRLQQVQAFASGDADAALGKLLTENHTPNLTEFKGFWRLNDAEMKSLLADHNALPLNDHIISRAYLGTLANACLKEAVDNARTNPDRLGLKENEFQSIPRIFAPQVLAALVKTEKLTHNNGVYAPRAHEASLPPELAKRYELLKPQLDTSQPPSSGDLAKAWSMPLKDLEQEMRELSRRGLLIFIAEHRYYLPQQVQRIAEQVKTMASKAPFTVREFRDATGIGRNVAIDLLEYFDSKGFTRRQDNHRVILRDKL